MILRYDFKLTPAEHKANPDFNQKRSGLKLRNGQDFNQRIKGD